MDCITNVTCNIPAHNNLITITDRVEIEWLRDEVGLRCVDGDPALALAQRLWLRLDEALAHPNPTLILG